MKFDSTCYTWISLVEISCLTPRVILESYWLKISAIRARRFVWKKWRWTEQTSKILQVLLCVSLLDYTVVAHLTYCLCLSDKERHFGRCVSFMLSWQACVCSLILTKYTVSQLKIYCGRDGCRTPMQWNREHKNAGFCNKEVTPWNPVHRNYTHKNVQAELEDPTSVLSAYRSIILLRKGHACLSRGSMTFPDKDDSTLVHFTRSIQAENGKPSEEIRIVINMTRMSSSLEGLRLANLGTCLYSTDSQRAVGSPVSKLRPYEGICLKIQ